MEKQRGNSTVLVSIIVMLLLMMSGTFMTTLSKQNREILAQERLSKSYYTAETGIHRAIASLLEQPPMPYSDPLRDETVRKGKESISQDQKEHVSWEILYSEEDAYLVIATGYVGRAKTMLSAKVHTDDGQVFIEYMTEI